MQEKDVLLGIAGILSAVEANFTFLACNESFCVCGKWKYENNCNLVHKLWFETGTKTQRDF